MAAQTWTKVLGYASSITKAFCHKLTASLNDAKSYLGKEERLVMRRLTDIAVIYTLYQGGMEVYGLTQVARKERSLGIFLRRVVLHYEIANFPDVRVMEDVMRRKEAKEFLKAVEKAKEQAAAERKEAEKEAKKKAEEKAAKDLAALEANKKHDEEKKKDK